MDFKLHINRLTKEDLEYILTVYGADLPSTVSEMRGIYRHLLKLAKTSSSYVKPTYPFTYVEDSEAIQAKFTFIEGLIEQFVGNRASSDFQRISTALAFISSRIDNACPQSEEEKNERAKFAVHTAVLANRLYSKARTLERASTFSLLASPTSGSNVPRESEEESCDEDDPPKSPVNVLPNPAHSTFACYTPKAVPVASWGIKFSGLKKDYSVSAFLERVAELKISRNSSDHLLFNSAIDLFVGPALIWYRANRDSFTNWSELAAGLRNEFQAIDYDDRLLDEIKQRTQGPNETIGLYVSVMKNLFSRLSNPVPEENQLRILQRNILPFYQTQLGLTEVHTVAELLKFGKVLEARKASAEAYVPPPLRGKTLEPDLAYVGTDPIPNRPRVRVAPVSANPVKCWNCRQSGHRYTQCSLPRKRFCYRCGRPDTIVSSCPQCSGNDRRAH